MERALYRPIVLHPITLGAVCRQPSSHERVQLDTPALDVMTDFQQVLPAMIRPDATLTQASDTMIARGVRFLFVVDGDDAIIGVVTARDLAGDHVARAVRATGTSPARLGVGAVMTLQQNMEAMTLNDVMHAEVGHVLETLRQVGRQHALVIETHAESGGILVRGIFSATHIGRRLGVAMSSFEAENTFREIETALAG